jgi:YfiH family protein
MLSFYRFSHFKVYASLLHAVTTKSEDKPYAFSLALHTGETAESIMTNRQQLAKKLQSDTSLTFIVANQIHSDTIRVIDKASTSGWESLSDAIEDCDALVTNIPHVVLTILTADCVPILLYDPIHEVIAAVHAGWKGSKAEIVKKTVQKMTEIFGCYPSDIQAGIAPAIGGCCYEVGKEVAEHFFYMPDAYKQKDEKYMLDLPNVNKQQLLDAGLKEENIEMSHICTACDVEYYFSYRKEQGCSGRFMSIIGLKDRNEN